jgi:hypothetical protein
MIESLDSKELSTIDHLEASQDTDEIDTNTDVNTITDVNTSTDVNTNTDVNTSTDVSTITDVNTITDVSTSNGLNTNTNVRTSISENRKTLITEKKTDLKIKIFDLVTNISFNPICKICKRSEKDMTGSNKNTSKRINIFGFEQLCIDCEIIRYPERFHGCGFCKRPIREKFSCTICSNGFVDWVKDVIMPLDNTSKLLRMSASRLLNKTIHDIKIDQRQFILRTDDGFYEWPGFYAGLTNRFSSHDTKRISTRSNISTKKKNGKNIVLDIDSDIDFDFDSEVDSEVDRKVEIKNNILHEGGFFPIWIIPKLTKKHEIKFSDIKISLNPFDHILLDILEKNDIHLYSDVQIDPNTFGSDQIKGVNTYDTRVIKSK